MNFENEENMSQMHNQWLKHQNIWRQIRHGLFGPWGYRRRWWIVLSLKALVTLALIAVSISYFLPSYTRSSHYKKDARAALEEALCLESRSASFNLQSQNMRDWTIPKLSLQGNERAFFKNLVARNIRGKASLLQGLMGSWRPYSLSIDSLDVLTQNEVKTGLERYQTLFHPFWIEHLSIRSLSLRWAENNYSSWLEGTSCEAYYEDGSWILLLKGGILHSSMFVNSRLIEARVVLAPGNEIRIESCRFQVSPAANATDRSVLVELNGSIAWESNSQPHFTAHMRSSGIPLRDFVSSRLGDMINGTFAAEGVLHGPFNVPSEWVGTFRLRNQGNVEVTNVPLLQKLDEMLIHRTYRNMTCPEFSFDAVFSYQTRTWKARHIAIRSDASDDVRITGDLSSRPMTESEWKQVCKRFPGRVSPEDDEESFSQIMYFTGVGSPGNKMSDDGSSLLTRHTPFFEGNIAISLPRQSLHHLLPIVSQAMKTRHEGDRLVIELPVKDIVSEAGKAEANRLQRLWINNRGEQFPNQE